MRYSPWHPNSNIALSNSIIKIQEPRDFKTIEIDVSSIRVPKIIRDSEYNTLLSNVKMTSDYFPNIVAFLSDITMSSGYLLDHSGRIRTIIYTPQTGVMLSSNYIDREDLKVKLHEIGVSKQRYDNSTRPIMYDSLNNVVLINKIAYRCYIDDVEFFDRRDIGPHKETYSNLYISDSLITIYGERKIQVGEVLWQ